ncbi:MAG TPA: hypothetical protein VFK85_15155 [Anaeromyxobacteraceae bacterium]|nr:hypothetical protein [Anaeromyxobacteraceae bacterium]
MRVLTWNLALGTWLMVSCFVFSQTAPSIILGYSVAVIVLAASIAAQAKPFARYAITAIALLFAIVSLVLPDLSWAARLSNVVTAGVLVALSLVSPRRARWEGEETTPIVPPPHHAAHGHTVRA